MIDHLVDWTAAARPGRRIGHAIEAHSVIESTNDRARELLAEPGTDGIVVVADAQSAGRGRRGRTWLSPAGRSLSMSAAVRPALGARDAWQLALGAALAAAEACDSVAAGVALKWPNDLVAGNDDKLGGILIETAVEGEHLAGVVIGIGINVDWRRAQMPEEIRATACSLSDLSDPPGGPIDRVELLGRLLDGLSDEIDRIEAGASPRDRYRARCSTLGSHVRVTVAGATIEGRAVDLDDTGGLVVDDGARRHVVAGGEVVTVRGDRA
ncbi:MAG TPA: biotin--[acetyl-CoA-carboxylase] ligase [Candidatus Limnocylindria bacterium]